MVKKLFCLFFTFFASAAWLSTPLMAQYRTEDIVVPPGFKVIKVAESNRISEPYRLTFDSAGNLLVGTYGFMFFKVDPTGALEILGKTRRYTIFPMEVEPAPDGSYMFRSTGGGTPASVYRFTQPDSYERVFAANTISSIGFDHSGNFYAAVQESRTSTWTIVRYNSDYSPVETTEMTGAVRDFVFDDHNNLFALQQSAPGLPGHAILKIPAGDNGIPGPEDPQAVFASGLGMAYDMAIDDTGNIYTAAYIRQEINGFSAYNFYQLEKTHTDGHVEKGFGPELPEPKGLACRDGFIYLSEWAGSVVSKIDLATGKRTEFTEDFGLAGPGAIAFDANGGLYTHVFRECRLLRMNADGSFSQVGDGTGYCQTIASDGSHFYLASVPTWGGGTSACRILRIDPMSGETIIVATGLNSFRMVTFDSFGRLIFCSIVNDPANLHRADIIDLHTGQATPYITGLHNKNKGMAFDSHQNFYVVEGIGDGIKKVPLLENYDPPLDVSDWPLFYNLGVGTEFPPTIYFIAVNDAEEVVIPRLDTGDVLLGDSLGNVAVLAQGFIMPVHATFDKYGALFISDSGNGIFKIIHERWAIPAVIGIKDMLLDEIRGSGIDEELMNSLVKKLENADKALERGSLTITPAIRMIEAFVNEVDAQSGKGIPSDLAARWREAAEKILEALKEIV